MFNRKICIVTGSRADYGLLYWLMKEIASDPELTLQLVVTGMHLSPEFGLTYKTIEEDGFEINEKIEMLLSSDTPSGIAKSIGLGVIGFADAVERLRPDILVVLGDRYEILAAVQAALVAKIPIAHIAGGDSTEGAIDEAIRHSITKMSHLHFVTNEQSEKRVRQLGENPDYIFNVGSPGLDFVKRVKLLDRTALEEVLEFTFKSKNLLITFHPATLDTQSPDVQCRAIFTALDNLPDDIGVIFTKPNSDTNGRAVAQLIDTYVMKHPNTKAFTSLGQIVYLSVMSQVDVVVGNSSSGLYETPSFRKPTVNVGDRQKGRIQASSIINCPPEANKIREGIARAFTLDCADVVNPYGDGNSSTRIKEHLKRIPDPIRLIKKHFFDVPLRYE